jgi:hypothetical protein
VVSTANNDIVLPDGLGLTPLEPDFLNQIWPINSMDSSMGSLLTVGTIFVVALIVAVVLGVIGRGMPKVKGALFSTLFFGLALAIAGTGFLTIKHWNAPNSVSESSLADINTETYNWLQANGVKVTTRESLDLVCDYYEAKSSFCTGAQPKAKLGGGERQIKMNKGNNGYMVLIDSKNQIPLIGEGAK